jgi:amylosucrase
MIATRKTIREFADFNNRQLHDPGNDHLFVFSRYNPRTGKCILVVGNFDTSPQHLDLSVLTHKPRKEYEQIIDLYSGERPALFGDELVVPPLEFYWLTGEACDRRNISRG